MVLVICMIAALFAGCGSGETKTSPAPAAPSAAEGKATEAKGSITIGCMAPLTGNWAEHGKGFQVAMTMAAEEINAAGGINGRELVLKFGDSEGDNAKATDVATAFADEKDIVAIMGGFSSGCCLSAAPVLEDYGIALTSPSASNIAFAKSNKYSFSIGGKSSEEAPFLLKIGAADIFKAKSVAIFGLNSDWGVSALAGAKAGAEEAGIEVLACEQYISGETDFSALITKVRAIKPDMIIILDQSPSILINQIRSAGIDTPIGIFGSSISQEVIDLCGENAEGCIVTGTYTATDGSDPVGTAFKEEFMKRAGFAPTIMATSAYVVTYMYAHALERCGDNITRENFRDQLEAADEDTLIGHVVFDQDGNISLNYRIYQVTDGAWKMVDYNY